MKFHVDIGGSHIDIEFFHLFRKLTQNNNFKMKLIYNEKLNIMV
jgi:hypothetical protein